MVKLTTFLIVTAYIVYFILTPPLTINDEPAHVSIIVGVSQGNYPHTLQSDKKNYQLGANTKISNALQYVDHPFQIPTFKTIGQLKEEKNDYNMTNVSSHEAYSPPLYYMVGSVFYYLSKITPYLLGQFYIIRLTSALFYFGTVFIAWEILLIFFKNKITASSLLLFFSINPLVLKMGIGVNPDIGVTFFSLCFLYALLKLSFNKFFVKNILIISLLSALATLTKISGVFTNLAFLVSIFFMQKFRRITFYTIGVFQGIFLLITFPWFLFAFNRYHTFFPEPFSTTCVKLGNDFFMSKVIETFTTFRFTIMNYAGFMGEGWPYPFKWFFVSYVVLFVFFSVCGLIYVLKQKEDIYKKLLVYIIPMFLLLTAMSAQYRIKQIDCDIQGRYMMPIFFILSLFVYWGILTIIKNEKKATQIVKYFAIFQYLFILFTVLIVRYYV